MRTFGWLWIFLILWSAVYPVHAIIVTDYRPTIDCSVARMFNEPCRIYPYYKKPKMARMV